MWSREKRILVLALFAVAVVAGIAFETVLDPIERMDPAYALAGLVVGLLAVGGVAGHWYARRLATVDEPDERRREIEWRSSRLSQGALTVGLAAVASVLLVPWVEAPVALVLWLLLAVSLGVHELSVEYYRRTM